MKKLFLLFLVFASSSLFAQTPPPVYAPTADNKFQLIMGKIFESKAIQNGASITSDRTIQTLYSVGKGAAAAAATAAVGLAVVGTAPGWGTVLGTAAVFGVVGGVISLGLNHVDQWLFGSNAAKPVRVGVVGYVGSIFICSSGNATGSDCTCNAPQVRANFSARPDLGSNYYQLSCNAPPTFAAEPTAVPAAAAALSPESLTQPVDYASLAVIANYLHQKAASEVGYAGIPYNAAAPITVAQVRAVAEANPSLVPPVSSLFTPVDSAGGFALGSSAQAAAAGSPSGYSPVLAPPTGGFVSPPAAPVVDLGPNPGTPPPTLDAPDWFQPLLNMLPGWRSASFTSQGQCMKPSFDLRPVMNSVIEMHSHCDLFEQNRALLASVMAVVWVMLAAFIVLGA